MRAKAWLQISLPLCQMEMVNGETNLIATAANTAHIFVIENEADTIQIKSLRKNLHSYEQHLRDLEKRNETIKSYLQVATKFLLYLDRIEKSNPTEVTVIDIREFITDLGANGHRGACGLFHRV